MRYILFFLLLHTFLYGYDILKIKEDNNFYNVGKHLSYCTDKKGNYNISDVMKMKFKTYNKSIANFGFLSSVYWFKLKFSYDKRMVDKKWFFSIENPLLNYVDLYLFNNKQKLLFKKQSGNLRKNSEFYKDTLLFDLPSDKNDIYTLYIRVKTSGSMFVPMRIVDSKILLKSTHLHQTLSGVYYGVLFVLILYNLITFLYTKEKVYLFYVFFVISYALWQLSFDGLGVLYMWSENYWMREKGTTFFIYTSVFSLLIFSQTLLKAKRNIPKINKFFLVPLKYITILGIVMVVFLPYKYTIVFGAILSIIVPATLFIGGIVVLNKDYFSVRLFVLGWGVFLVSTILFTLSKFDLIPGYVIMKYGQQIGSVVDMILLSGALADRLKRLEEEYTTKLKNHNLDLTKRVKEILKQERKKDKMLIEQSRLASMGEMIEQIAHQWRQPLNNIGLLNQDLFFKKELNTLKDEDFYKAHTQIDSNLQYMSNTIDDFRSYYKSDKKVEIYTLYGAINTILNIMEASFKHSKIELILDVDKNVKVKNVKNEFYQVVLNILNNAKDALLINNVVDKMVYIKVKYDDKCAYMEIHDNAGGIPKNIINKIFDPYFTTKFSKQGTGIGLYMSKMIVENNMAGELSVENIENGACFYIKLPCEKESEDVES